MGRVWMQNGCLMAFPNFRPLLIISGSLLASTRECDSLKYLATLHCKSHAAPELCACLLCRMCTCYNIPSAIRLYTPSLFFTAMFKTIMGLINIILFHIRLITQFHNTSTAASLTFLLYSGVLSCFGSSDANSGCKHWRAINYFQCDSGLSCFALSSPCNSFR